MAEVTPEQVTQVLNEVQAPAATAAQALKRIETSTGQVFEGQTDEELLRKLTASVESGTTHIHNLNQRLDELQQQVRQPQTPQNGQKSAQDQYWEIWQKDPIAADRYAKAVRLGVPVDAVDQIERQTIQNASALAQNTALADFKDRCPDYPTTDTQAAEAMKGYLAQRFPGQQVTADTLELAFNHLVRTGQVVPLDVPIEGYGDPQMTMPNPGPGQQLPQADFERQFRSMTTEQQKQAIQELYSRGLR